MTGARHHHRVGGLATPLRVPVAALGAVAAPVGPAGIVVGADPDGAPVTLALLRPVPTRVVVLGALHLARQLALRTAASGARLDVVTGRAATWQPIARAVADPARVRVVADDRLSAPAAAGPGDTDALLAVHDRGAVSEGPAAPNGPRRTTMLVLPSLSPAVADAADDADVVLLGRMPPHEADLAARLWRLGDTMADSLRMLPDHGVVALGRDLWRRVDLVTAEREVAILGPVRRG